MSSKNENSHFQLTSIELDELSEMRGKEVINKAMRPRMKPEEIMYFKDKRVKEQLSNSISLNNVKAARMNAKGEVSYTFKPNDIDYDKLKEEIIKDMDKRSAKYPKLKRKASKDGHLLIIDPADVHFGKLASSFETGKSYDIEETKKRVLDGVQGILDKSSGFNIDKIVLILGNDMLHIDNPARKTTSGTPQDTDGMWYDAFNAARDTFIKVVELLQPLAPIHIVYNPSNHDYMSGFMLADSIKSWFRNTDITFDFDMRHRKYFRYHDNLIGCNHGDGAKEKDLPALMAHESKDWSSCKFRYIYTHHVHHKVAKDHIGVTIEALRSPSESDSWHSRNGYCGALPAIEGFIHSKNAGQVSRITHYF